MVVVVIDEEIAISDELLDIVFCNVCTTSNNNYK